MNKKIIVLIVMMVLIASSIPVIGQNHDKYIFTGMFDGRNSDAPIVYNLETRKFYMASKTGSFTVIDSSLRDLRNQGVLARTSNKEIDFAVPYNYDNFEGVKGKLEFANDEALLDKDTVSRYKNNVLFGEGTINDQFVHINGIVYEVYPDGTGKMVPTLRYSPDYMETFDFDSPRKPLINAIVNKGYGLVNRRTTLPASLSYLNDIQSTYPDTSVRLVDVPIDSTINIGSSTFTVVAADTDATKTILALEDSSDKVVFIIEGSPTDTLAKHSIVSTSGKFYWAGTDYFAQGDYGEIIRQFSPLIDQNSDFGNDPVNRFKLATSYYMESMNQLRIANKEEYLNKAELEIREAMRLDPQNQAAYSHLLDNILKSKSGVPPPSGQKPAKALPKSKLITATELLESGSYTESIALFEEILEKDPNNIEVLGNIGMAYLMSDDADAYEKAREYYGRANKLVEEKYGQLAALGIFPGIVLPEIKPGASPDDAVKAVKDKLGTTAGWSSTFNDKGDIVVTTANGNTITYTRTKIGTSDGKLVYKYNDEYYTKDGIRVNPDGTAYTGSGQTRSTVLGSKSSINDPWEGVYWYEFKENGDLELEWAGGITVMLEKTGTKTPDGKDVYNLGGQYHTLDGTRVNPDGTPSGKAPGQVLVHALIEQRERRKQELPSQPDAQVIQPSPRLPMKLSSFMPGTYPQKISYAGDAVKLDTGETVYFPMDLTINKGKSTEKELYYTNDRGDVVVIEVDSGKVIRTEFKDVDYGDEKIKRIETQLSSSFKNSEDRRVWPVGLVGLGMPEGTNYLGLAEDAENRGDYKGAVKNYKKMLEFYSDKEPSDMRSREAQKAKEAQQRTIKNLRLKIAELAFYKTEDYDEAIKQYGELLDTTYLDNEDKRVALRLIGMAYNEKNDLDNAKEYLIESLKGTDGDDYIHDLIGDIYYKQGNYKEANTYYGKIRYPSESDIQLQKFTALNGELIELLKDNGITADNFEFKKGFFGEEKITFKDGGYLFSKEDGSLVYLKREEKDGNLEKEIRIIYKGKEKISEQRKEYDYDDKGKTKKEETVTTKYNKDGKVDVKTSKKSFYDYKDGTGEPIESTTEFFYDADDKLIGYKIFKQELDEKGKIVTVVNKKGGEGEDEEDLGEDTENIIANVNRGRTDISMSSIWSSMELAARGGVGRFAGLFMSEGKLKEWRDKVDKFFCNTILFGGEDCWTSKICQESIKRPNEGFAFVDIPGLTTRAGVFVLGERADMFYVDGSGTEVKEYLYKFNYKVENPTEGDIYFNVKLYGDQTRDMFEEDLLLEKGETESRIGNAASIKYSSNYYNKICIKFNKKIMFAGKTETDKVCNNIVKTTERTSTKYVLPEGEGDEQIQEVRETNW